MKYLKRTLIAFATIAAVTGGAAVWAHHSFAMFDQSHLQLIEGHVTEWHYNNPHSWLYVEGVDESGETTLWSFEAASPVHAARQGVTGNTYRRGDFVRVAMFPLKDGRKAGAVCFIVMEDGSFSRPNDGVCNSVAVIEEWNANGWVENGSNFDTHPHTR